MAFGKKDRHQRERGSIDARSSGEKPGDTETERCSDRKKEEMEKGRKQEGPRSQVRGEEKDRRSGTSGR